MLLPLGPLALKSSPRSRRSALQAAPLYFRNNHSESDSHWALCAGSEVACLTSRQPHEIHSSSPSVTAQTRTWRLREMKLSRKWGEKGPEHWETGGACLASKSPGFLSWEGKWSESLGCVWLFATPWTDYTFRGILQARILEWVAFWA